jgi:hypothetical protein
MKTVTTTTTTSENPVAYTNTTTATSTLLPWNGFAIAGFVLSLTIWPMAFIFSPIALSQFKRNGENWNRGRGLALAGLIISIVSAVITVLFWDYMMSDLYY